MQPYRGSKGKRLFSKAYRLPALIEQLKQPINVAACLSIRWHFSIVVPDRVFAGVVGRKYQLQVLELVAECLQVTNTGVNVLRGISAIRNGVLEW